jgi:anti-anti-sigma factor
MDEPAASTPGREPVTLELAGELEISSVAAARTRLVALELAAGDQLVLDLRAVTFIDSTGVRLILQAREHARRRRAGFMLLCGEGEVLRVLALSGLVDQLDIVSRPR